MFADVLIFGALGLCVLIIVIDARHEARLEREDRAGHMDEIDPFARGRVPVSTLTSAGSSSLSTGRRSAPGSDHPCPDPGASPSPDAFAERGGPRAVMPLFSMSLAFWFVLGGLVGVSTMFLRARNRLRGYRPNSWHVDVKPTADWVESSSDGYGYHTRRINVSSTVQIRLVGPKSTVLIDTVSLTEDDYEDRIHSAQAKAEERALTLNAMAVGA